MSLDSVAKVVELVMEEWQFLVGVGTVFILSMVHADVVHILLNNGLQHSR